MPRPWLPRGGLPISGTKCDRFRDRLVGVVVVEHAVGECTRQDKIGFAVDEDAVVKPSRELRQVVCSAFDDLGHGRDVALAERDVHDGPLPHALHAHRGDHVIPLG